MYLPQLSTILTTLVAVTRLALCASEPTPLERTLRLPETPPKPGACFAILATGDGGWAELDRRVAERLALADVPVVGWDSRAYYWNRRSPDAAAADLAKLLRRFRGEWNRPRALLIGYSRGADVLPFLVNRLPEGERKAVQLVALLGPGMTVDFEFHLLDYLRDATPKTALSVPPEIEKLRAVPLLVLYGNNDDSSCGVSLPKSIGRIQRLPGDHHFARDYDRLAAFILEAAGLTNQGAARH